MALTPMQILFGKIAAILGALQGSAWMGMSLACIIIYNSEKTIETSSTSYSTVLNSLFYTMYLNKQMNSGQSVFIIRPKDFQVFMWFYFLFSVALLSASVDLFVAILQNKKRQSKLMVLWGIITGCTSIIDLIFASLLLRDFNNCVGLSTVVDVITAIDAFLCRPAIGIPMTLAARGFMLWVVNIFLTYTMIASGIEIITHNRVKNAIQDISIPRVTANVQQQVPPRAIYGNYPPQVPQEHPQPAYASYPPKRDADIPHWLN